MTNIGVIGVGGWGKNHLRVLNEINCLKFLNIISSIHKQFKLFLENEGGK